MDVLLFIITITNVHYLIQLISHNFHIIFDSMSADFQLLAQTVTKSHSFHTQELRQYILFVLDQIPTIQRSYSQSLHNHLQHWMQTLFKSLQNAIYSKQTNQIGPKLQLIYTTVINQQPSVNQYLTKIGTLLSSQRYQFQADNGISQKGSGLKYTEKPRAKKVEGANSKIDEREAFDFNREKTISMKGRSLSNGSPRRKLSKMSCFAQAKKVQVNNFLQTQTSTQAFYKHNPSQKIKKAKKKEENGFGYLQKCMSSTSPSNFMLNYLSATAHPQSINRQPTRRRSGDKHDQKLGQSVLFPENNHHQDQRQQLSVPLNSVSSYNFNHQRNDSGSYQQIMHNLQQKMGQKMEQLMKKIEKKLQSEIHQPKRTESKKQPEYQIAVYSPQQTKQNVQPKPKLEDSKTFSYPPAEITQPAPEHKISFIERQTIGKMHEKENKDIETSKKKACTTSLNKSVLTKNKIIRNHIQEPSVLQDSIDSITLQKTSLKSLTLNQAKPKDPSMLNLDTIQKLQSKLILKNNTNHNNQQSVSEKQDKKKIQADHAYITKQILEFSNTTAKVKLPISKKLLFIVRKKYLAFCSKHKLNQDALVKSLEGQEMKNEVQQLKDCLQKMQKILYLKCDLERKKKLLLYVCNFLDSYLSFAEDSNIIQLPNEKMSQQTAENKIKQAIKKLQ